MSARPQRSETEPVAPQNDNEPLPFVSIGEAAQRVLAKLAAARREAK